MLRLRTVMNRRNLSTKGIAEVLGVSEKTMYNKLNGISDFTYKEATKLKTLFPEYNLDYLLSDEDPA